MVGVRTFLEASTIHGLNYISTTKKYARLFWILVVVAGFFTAILMINTSFEQWSANPIKTTLETRPISEIKFPKVTVCPPKNTFTDLNYDLMVAENMTLTEESQDELIQYARQVIIEHVFVDDFDIMQEDDRFYNWYHGYSNIFRPYINDKGLYYILETATTSGSANTQYFGEQFQSHLVKRNLLYYVYVYPPLSVRNNPNVTLHIKLEKLSMTGMSAGWDNTVLEGSNIEAGLSSATFNFTPPSEKRWIALTRNNITKEDLNTMDLKSMPGFQVSWYYTGLGQEILFKLAEKREVQLFIAFINLIQSLDLKTAWKHVINARGYFVQNYVESDCTYLLSNEDILKNTQRIKLQLFMQLINVSSSSFSKLDLDKDAINTGAKMFLFLNSCPNTIKQNWLLTFYSQVFKKKLFEPTKSGMIIYLLKAMKEQSSDGREIASKILKKVASMFRLPYAPSQAGFKVFNTDAMSSFNDFSSSHGKSGL